MSRILFHIHLNSNISNQIYIHRKVMFSDEEILENQQPPRKSAKIKFSGFQNINTHISESWLISYENCRRR